MTRWTKICARSSPAAQGPKYAEKPHPASQSVAIKSLKGNVQCCRPPLSYQYRGGRLPLAQTEEEEKHLLDFFAAIKLCINYRFDCHMNRCFRSALHAPSRFHPGTTPPHSTMLPPTIIGRPFSLTWLTSIAFAARK